MAPSALYVAALCSRVPRVTYRCRACRRYECHKAVMESVAQLSQMQLQARSRPQQQRPIMAAAAAVVGAALGAARAAG
jgi:hypothetical protein